jgi:dodecin
VSSYLLVANQTSGGEALATHLRRVIATDPDARFVVLVPMGTPAPVDLGGSMGVMSGVAVLDPTIQAEIQDVARRRLDRILEWLRDSGAVASGSVVGDPLPAMDAAVEAEPFDEIIVSTLPARMAQWMRRDLVRRASRRFSIPVTTVMAADTEPPPVIPAAGVSAAAAASRPETAVGDATPAAPTAVATPASPPESAPAGPSRKRAVMGESVYKIVELVGTSTESWEKAAAAAVAMASQSLRDLRVAEVVELDMVIDAGNVAAYRAKVKVSFKYEGDD